MYIQNNQDEQQKCRVFYLFCLVSQGILNDCFWINITVITAPCGI